MIRLYLLWFDKRRRHQWKMVSIVFQCFHCVTKLGKIMTLCHNMIIPIILLTFSPLLSFQLPITTPKSLKSSFTETVSSIEAQHQNTHRSPSGTRKSSLLDSTTPSSHMLTLMVGIQLWNLCYTHVMYIIEELLIWKNKKLIQDK